MRSQKSQTQLSNCISRHASLMNVDAKMLKKALANQIQYVKRTVHMIKWYLFQGCKDGSTSTNQCDMSC